MDYDKLNALVAYQVKSQRTIDGSKTTEQNLTNFCLGLCGETGEVIDILKKHLFHCHVLDKEHLSEELGDVMFYLAGIASLCGLDLSTIANNNVKKLLKRYPRGFDPVASRERVE